MWRVRCGGNIHSDPERSVLKTWNNARKGSAIGNAGEDLSGSILTSVGTKGDRTAGDPHSLGRVQLGRPQWLMSGAR